VFADFNILLITELHLPCKQVCRACMDRAAPGAMSATGVSAIHSVHCGCCSLHQPTKDGSMVWPSRQSVPEVEHRTTWTRMHAWTSRRVNVHERAGVASANNWPSQIDVTLQLDYGATCESVVFEISSDLLNFTKYMKYIRMSMLTS